MKKRLQGFVAGILCCLLLAGISVLAKTGSEWIEAYYNDVKIYVDGKKVNPKDVNGNTVEPFVYNGTTYLPVRAVGNAIGKAVYWDGETSSVFLGNMDGALESPSIRLSEANYVGGGYNIAQNKNLKDNYENSYSEAFYYGDGYQPQYILNSKYSRFKGTLYIPYGTSYGSVYQITIEADGKTIYKSPEMDKTSKPVDIDVSVKGCNVFKIKCTLLNSYSGAYIHLGDAGFYQ